MTNAQKPNKHLRTKSCKKTTTAGPRGKKRLKHGIGRTEKRSGKYKKRG